MKYFGMALIYLIAIYLVFAIVVLLICTYIRYHQKIAEEKLIK